MLIHLIRKQKKENISSLDEEMDDLHGKYRDRAKERREGKELDFKDFINDTEEIVSDKVSVESINQTTDDTDKKDEKNSFGMSLLSTIRKLRSPIIKPGPDIFSPGKSSYVFNVERVVVRYLFP